MTNITRRDTIKGGAAMLAASTLIAQNANVASGANNDLSLIHI